jgi:lipoprotein NlpD
VAERAAPASRPDAAARGGRDNYVVRKGDTLYSIAREAGRDPRDIAAWNNLEAPGALRIGQTLRIAPPDGPATAASAAVAKPVAGPAEVEVKPLTPAAGTEAPRAAGDTLKREPRGGKQPYSEQALAMLQRKDAAPAPAVPARPETKAEPKPETRVEPKPEAKVEPRPEAGADAKSGDNDSGIDWMWPGGGKLLATFNEPSSKGLDIAGKPGDAVLAAAPGRVMYVGSGIRGYGNLVIIKHSNGYLSAYGHNRKILVKEGQSIAKGQKVAELGDSDTDQPKLHFEIRRQGKPVDPLKYLPPR